MAEHDDRALISASVRAFRSVLGQLAAPAPRLSAALLRAEGLCEPLDRLPRLELDPFAALPAEPLPASSLPEGPQKMRAGRPVRSPAAPPADRPDPRGPAGGTTGRHEPSPRPAPAADTSPAAGTAERSPVYSFRQRRAATPAVSAPADQPLRAVAHDDRTTARKDNPQPAPESPPRARAASPAPAGEPAEGMTLLGRLAAEVLHAPSPGHPIVAPASRLGSPSAAAGAERQLTQPARAAAAWPGRALEPAQYEDARLERAPAAFGSHMAPEHALASPPLAIAEQAGAARPGARAQPPTPDQLADLAQGITRADDRPDAAELARLISDILVEQARMHGVDLL